MSAKKKPPAVPKTPHRGRRKIAHIPLALDSIPVARRTWAAVINLYNSNLISSAKARDLNSFMKTLLSFMLGDKDQEFECRLTEIEAEILAIKQERKMEIVR